jgi:hypothetical protein
VTDTLLSKIKHRVFELLILSGGKLSRAEATRLAAKQFGRVEQLKDTAKITRPKPQPVVANDEGGDAREILFGKIAAIRQRMFPDASDEEDLTDRLFGAESQRPLTENTKSPSQPVGTQALGFGRRG